MSQTPARAAARVMCARRFLTRPSSYRLQDTRYICCPTYMRSFFSYGQGNNLNSIPFQTSFFRWLQALHLLMYMYTGWSTDGIPRDVREDGECGPASRPHLQYHPHRQVWHNYGRGVVYLYFLALRGYLLICWFVDMLYFFFLLVLSLCCIYGFIDWSFDMGDEWGSSVFIVFGTCKYIYYR